jgi:hypothetical protein
VQPLQLARAGALSGFAVAQDSSAALESALDAIGSAIVAGRPLPAATADHCSCQG